MNPKDTIMAQMIVLLNDNPDIISQLVRETLSSNFDTLDSLSRDPAMRESLGSGYCPETRRVRLDLGREG